jgi:hypothetical protein
VAETDLVPPQIVSPPNASKIWQAMFRKLSA